MNKTVLAAVLIIFLSVFSAGCLSEQGSPAPNEKAPAVPRTAETQLDPKQVADAFIRALVKNNREAADKLMTDELRRKFQEQDLYLWSTEQLADKNVTLNSIDIGEDEGKKKGRLYTVQYEITLEEDGIKEQRQVTDLVFVSQEESSGKWFVTTYQHVLFQ